MLSYKVVVATLALLLSACTQAAVLPATGPTVRPALSQTLPAAAAEASGVRACLYVPGQSKPLPIMPEMFNTPAPIPSPTAIPFKTSTVDAETTARQIVLYTKIWTLVNDRYAYRDFHGVDWTATGKRYEALIRKGLAMEDFYRAMNEMILQLGDDHSHLNSPDQVKLYNQARQGKTDFVGIGAAYSPVEDNGKTAITVVDIFPGSPAEKAGLKSHDTVTQVDGGPVLDNSGALRTAGPENTPVTITVNSPGQPSRTVTLMRQQIQSDIAVDFCLVPKTHIGYIGVRNYLDIRYPSQISQAIQKMSAQTPLEGLILDNRRNGGGEGATEKEILALFTKGELGKAVGSGGQDSWNITNPLDIDGSQHVPMVVLVDEFSASGGEIVPGMLQNNHRAIVVGNRTRGLTDALETIPLMDGSELFLATMAFQPTGGEPGQWEKKGITPDVVIPARWNQYSEANDPMLAKAVELLQKK